MIGRHYPLQPVPARQRVTGLEISIACTVNAIVWREREGIPGRDGPRTYPKLYPRISPSTFDRLIRIGRRKSQEKPT